MPEENAQRLRVGDGGKDGILPSPAVHVRAEFQQQAEVVARVGAVPQRCAPAGVWCVHVQALLDQPPCQLVGAVAETQCCAFRLAAMRGHLTPVEDLLEGVEVPDGEHVLEILGQGLALSGHSYLRRRG